MKNLIAKRRRDRGIGQAELASKVGISRQSLHAIENGYQEPRISLALAIARELGTGVDELFRSEMSDVIRIDDPGDNGGFRANCSFIEGKWVYRKAIAPSFAQLPTRVDAIVSSKNGHFEIEDEFSKSFFFIDGCDPTLGVIAGRVNDSLRDKKISWFSGSNAISMAKLRDGLTHCSVVHGSGEELAELASSLPEFEFMPLGDWELVLAFSPGNPKSISSYLDLARGDVAIAMRESGSGVRKFMDRLLGDLGANQAMASNVPVFTDHYQVSGAIALGICDLGIIPVSVAQSSGLEYLALGVHKSALVFSNNGYEIALAGGLLDVIFSKSTARDLASLGGYHLAL